MVDVAGRLEGGFARPGDTWNSAKRDPPPPDLQAVISGSGLSASELHADPGETKRPYPEKRLILFVDRLSQAPSRPYLSDFLRGLPSGDP